MAVAVRSFETSATSVTAQTQARIWHNVMRTSELETAFSSGQTFNVAGIGVGIWWLTEQSVGWSVVCSRPTEFVACFLILSPQMTYVLSSVLPQLHAVSLVYEKNERR
jgi:hypothetical protein